MALTGGRRSPGTPVAASGSANAVAVTLVQRGARAISSASDITSELGEVRFGEITLGQEVAESATGLKGEYAEQVSTGVDVYSTRRPLGVVGVISPKAPSGSSRSRSPRATAWC